MLIRARIWMIRVARHFNSFEVLAVAFAVAAQDNDYLPSVVARSPVPVVLVIADCFGQSILWSKVVYGACLPVAIREDCRPRPLIGRQLVIDFGDRAGHILPTKLISKVLG